MLLLKRLLKRTLLRPASLLELLWKRGVVLELRQESAVACSWQSVVGRYVTSICCIGRGGKVKKDVQLYRYKYNFVQSRRSFDLVCLLQNISNKAIFSVDNTCEKQSTRVTTKWRQLLAIKWCERVSKMILFTNTPDYHDQCRKPLIIPRGNKAPRNASSSNSGLLAAITLTCIVVLAGSLPGGAFGYKILARDTGETDR